MAEPARADDLEGRALDELGAANDLAEIRRWAQAFYHAGFAVELALKCRIMRVERLNRWPDPPSRYYTHDLAKLAAYAGLTSRLELEVAGATAIGLAWMVAKDWSIGTRYDVAPFPPRRGADMIEAVEKRGLVRWLLA